MPSSEIFAPMPIFPARFSPCGGGSGASGATSASELDSPKFGTAFTPLLALVLLDELGDVELAEEFVAGVLDAVKALVETEFSCARQIEEPNAIANAIKANTASRTKRWAGRIRLFLLSVRFWSAKGGGLELIISGGMLHGGAFLFGGVHSDIAGNRAVPQCAASGSITLPLGCVRSVPMLKYHHRARVQQKSFWC